MADADEATTMVMDMQRELKILEEKIIALESMKDDPDFTIGKLNQLKSQTGSISGDMLQLSEIG